MTRRVIFSFMSVILLVLVLTEAIFFVVIHRYYYNGITDTLLSHVETSSAFFTKYEGEQLRDIPEKSHEIIKSFAYPGTELELVNRQGEVLISSTGFDVDETIDLKSSILKGDTASEVEKTSTGEKILSVYSPLKYNEQTIAVLRYKSTLEEVDRAIRQIMTFVTFIGLSVAVLVFLISLRLSHSIVRPIKEITSASSRMAMGHFSTRMNEGYKHELGELSRTLNYMADEIKKTDKMKSDFISSISHEIRTPLTGIKGWVETMKADDSLTRQELDQGFQIISSETDRLIVLLEELLDFSHFQSNRMKLHRSPTRLDHLIEQTIIQSSSKAKKAGVTLLVKHLIEKDILIDGNRMKQVLVNLVDNAIKYSPVHSTITVRMKEHADSMEIEVKDDGMGISKEQLPLIKNTFYQVNAEQSGSGIVLSIANEIIELHGGRIEIESVEGRGTSVFIILPLK
ncbi:MAG: HAMP domain-containing sensor histidine kinase [Anaerobacillus sp.]